MTNKQRKTSPTWSDLKSDLSEFDRVELLRLVHDLYAASKDNRIFLHARFGLGADILKPYEAIIDRWLCPDVSKNEDMDRLMAELGADD